VNSLAALHYTELFGRAGVYQLVPAGREASRAPGELRGRDLFAAQASFGHLESRIGQGATVKATPITTEFDFDDFEAIHGARTLPLLRLSPEGRLTVFTPDEPPGAADGDTLFSLLDPERPPAG